MRDLKCLLLDHTVPELRAPSILSEICMHVITLQAKMEGPKCGLTADILQCSVPRNFALETYSLSPPDAILADATPDKSKPKPECLNTITIV